MTKRSRSAMIAAILVAALAGRALGDPDSTGSPTASPPTSPPTAPLLGTGFYHVTAHWHLLSDSGVTYDMPPAFILDEPTWLKLDTEVRRLQDAETRLTAENKSMRTSLSGWQPGWWTLAGAVVGGLALGYYVHDKL